MSFKRKIACWDKAATQSFIFVILLDFQILFFCFKSKFVMLWFTSWLIWLVHGL